MWVRFGPRWFLQRLEAETGLPEGFWYVVLVTVGVSVVVSLSVVVGSYRYFNSCSVVWVPSESE